MFRCVGSLRSIGSALLAWDFDAGDDYNPMATFRFECKFEVSHIPEGNQFINIELNGTAAARRA